MTPEQLQDIKERWANVTPGSGHLRFNANLRYEAPSDVAALIKEVERLKNIILELGKAISEFAVTEKAIRQVEKAAESIREAKDDD